MWLVKGLGTDKCIWLFRTRKCYRLHVAKFRGLQQSLFTKYALFLVIWFIKSDSGATFNFCLDIKQLLIACDVLPKKIQ